MTPAELRAAILDGPLADQCAPHVHDNAAPKISGAEAFAKDQAIAGILNARDQTRIVSRRMTEADLLGDLGPETADALLAKLDACAATNGVVARSLRALYSTTGLDIGHPQTLAALAQLVAAQIIEQSEFDALLALVTVPASQLEASRGESIQITAADVSRAIRGPWT